MGNVQTAASAHEVLWRQAPSGDLVDLGRPHRLPLGQLRLQKAPKAGLRRREAIALGVIALLLHGAVIYWINQQPTPVLPIVPPEIPPMTIEFSRPAPPVVEPPPPQPVQPVVEPPPPVEDELAVKPPPPKPVPKPKLQPKPKPVAKPEPKPAPKPVQQQPAPPQPAAPVAAPAPPAPPAPAPVTPASANAAYLKNPAPEYPSLAQRRGWEGTVLLRVHVLASGKPGEIQIQKSSGRQQLDDAALSAVKRWSFVPAKQGDVAQDGWVSVPIDFKIH
ncbi:outer membrane transport energization protein TonB [Pseudomonas sp. NFIX51]|jgi:periplasmic protein TonB|uniref:energy transducer TonB n=1 Tax=Pseudomonas TaxID=286 RepID=UPI0008B622C7|nr:MULTISPECIES: energy transducer TonB [Pseudomonas]WDH35675.1 energy transducer TonB [Pseudomonas chlororaphis]WDH41760.1 energy transducer TonB [Pseudomonas chlororaphis]SEM40002.1 outer membrane transport energization protein TonB [Pseudomonas sp. NFACC41-3]SMH59054.1 outer membrane transport energization protein TonB [Pseudomonas sp. NFIX51]